MRTFEGRRKCASAVLRGERADFQRYVNGGVSDFCARLGNSLNKVDDYIGKEFTRALKATDKYEVQLFARFGARRGVGAMRSMGWSGR